MQAALFYNSKSGTLYPGMLRGGMSKHLVSTWSYTVKLVALTLGNLSVIIHYLLISTLQWDMCKCSVSFQAAVFVAACMRTNDLPVIQMLLNITIMFALVL